MEIVADQEAVLAEGGVSSTLTEAEEVLRLFSPEEERCGRFLGQRLRLNVKHVKRFSRQSPSVWPSIWFYLVSLVKIKSFNVNL